MRIGAPEGIVHGDTNARESEELPYVVLDPIPDFREFCVI